jgi:hypothetical protein
MYNQLLMTGLRKCKIQNLHMTCTKGDKIQKSVNIDTVLIEFQY